MNFDIIKNNYDIASVLTKMLEKEFHKEFYHTSTIFDAYRIEKEYFVDVMELLLRCKGIEDWDDLYEEISEYRHSKMEDIPNCKDIFIKFMGYVGDN